MSSWCWYYYYLYIDDLSCDLTSGGAINNLANASGISASGYGVIATNMNIIDNRPPPPPPHSNLHHLSGN